MLARIQPAPLSGSIDAIASKSMAHRLIIAAALSGGVTHIRCNTTCADIDATVQCMEALGARIHTTSYGFEVHPVPKSLEFGLLKALHGATLDCQESGSTLRFLLPVACALGAQATFTGAGRLGDRPLQPLTEELMAAGCDFSAESGLPLSTSGRMRAGTFILPGNVSSQFVSGLLLAAPLVHGVSTIEVRGTLESKPYVNMTIQALRIFGISVDVETGTAPDGIEALTRFTVADESYRTPGVVEVEGDWSNAAFWLCAGALGRSSVRVTGVSLTSVQGDRNVLAALSCFGARVRRMPEAATIQPDFLRAYSMSAHDIPDLVPVISAVAACCEGTTEIRDCARLRIKESDRLATTASELSALGADIQIHGDSLIITGKDRLSGGDVFSHNDHRIAMMAAIAAIRCENEVRIHGAEAVAKSYPAFFEHYRALGGNVTLEEE